MRHLLHLLLALALTGFLPAAKAAAAGLTLGPDTPVLIHSSEPAPVRRAVEDLARDWEKVLGRRLSIMTNLSQVPPGATPIIVTCVAAELGSLRRPEVVGAEAHALFAARFGDRPCLVLQGADARGTIYAIYTFADRFLDIPPLWYWASWRPTPKRQVTIPAELSLHFGPPHVRWRAWFPNDTDLIGRWERDSEEKREAIYETMLRLKLNVLDVGSVFDHPEPNGSLLKARAATRYGLAVTGTHTSPFAASFRNWTNYWNLVRRQEPPPLTLAHLDQMEQFWENHIRLGLREQFEMIWMIGFRGDRDVGFFEVMPDAPKGDDARAKVIERVMRRQVALLKRVTGQAHPLMRTVLYNENSDYFAANLFRPPDEPSLIWNFCSARRDHHPATDLLGFRPAPDRPMGYYFNFQFTSTGSHLAQGEGPWKMERNYRMVQAATTRPLDFSVVNMGNTREFVLEASANAALLWEFKGYDTDRFLTGFCARYFGPPHAAEAAGLYRRLFESYWVQRKPALPGFDRQFIFQDNRLARAAEQLLAQLPKGYTASPLDNRDRERFFGIVPADSGAPDQLQSLVVGTGRSRGQLDTLVADADALMPKLPPQGARFFADNLIVQARFLREANGMVHNLALALNSLRDPDRQTTRAHLAAAELAATAMREALREAEHGYFAGWYEGERVFGLENFPERIRNVRQRLQP